MDFFEMKLSFDIDFQESNHLVGNKHDILDIKRNSGFIGPEPGLLTIKNYFILMKYFRNYVALGCMQIYL